LGPRSRRRLAWLVGITVGPVAAGGAIYYLTGPRAHSTVVPIGINSGMSKARVLRVAGRPAARRGNCWIYLTNREIRGHHLDAESACFYDGHVYELRYKVDGKWAGPPQTRVRVGR
jgi:hypothetical protein